MRLNLFCVAVCVAAAGAAWLPRAGTSAAAETAPADPNLYGPGYTLGGGGRAHGLWVAPGSDHPFAAVYTQHGAAVVGLSKDQAGGGHQFAIAADKDEVYFQIVDDKGEYHFLPVTALLKLEAK